MDVKAIRTLLLADPAVMGIVSDQDKVVAGTVRTGTELPAVGIRHVSGRYIGKIDAQAPYSLAEGRVQVTAMAKDYPGAKALQRAVRKACNFKSGEIGGVTVVSILCDGPGPDLSDHAASIEYQSLDFLVTFHEPN